MKSIRLLPVVILAACALLVLKGIGLVSDGRYVLTGTEWVFAQGTADDGAAQNAAELEEVDGLSAQEMAAADRASDQLFSRASEPAVNSTQLDAVPFTETSKGEKVPIGSTDGLNETEKAVLDRLSERRAELDILARSLEDRQALVEAAEKRLNERIAELEALEARIGALVDEKKAGDEQQFADLVGMYENMKPKDAAAIFDTLNMEVLLRVAKQMNPRKMAPVMAVMDEDRARELTVQLAMIEPEPSLDAPFDDMSNLPQIVGQ